MRQANSKTRVATTIRKRAPKLRQRTIHRRGGPRAGAGRKPKGEKALVSHLTRPPVMERFPVLVTVKLEKGLPSLRRPHAREQVLAAFRTGGQRHGLRLVHFSIQSNHVHLLVEARDTPSLSRGMQGLSVRMARALNRVWNRAGRVFADRFHARVLKTPREARYAIAYVLNNARKHGVHLDDIDPCSSGAAFDGWREAQFIRLRATGFGSPPVAAPRAWLLTSGWKRHGRVSVWKIPGPSS